MANRGGFSWKRFLGVTKAKRRISKATGIPWTKSGRQRKIGKAVTGGCCAIPAFAFLVALTLLIVLTVSVFAHPGNTDARGGHQVTVNGWGYAIGTYHVHDKNGEVVPVDEETMLPTEITVSVNGERIIFDQKPVNIDGRVLVPVRYVVEELGCEVEWDGTTQTVYVFNDEYPKTVEDTLAIEVVVNGEAVSFDVPPQNINGRVLIPIRAVVEKLGCNVEWDGTLQTVYIESIIEEEPIYDYGSSYGNGDYSGSVGEYDDNNDYDDYDIIDETEDEVIFEEEILEEKPLEEEVVEEEKEDEGLFPKQNASGKKYVLNTSTKKIHYPSCNSVKDIKPENKAEGTWKIDALERFGYKPCGRCKP